MLHVEEISYDVDGETMVGELYVDDPGRGPRPSVLVCHAGTGLAPFHRARARRIAELGYCTFALDVFGGGVVHPKGGPRLERDVTRARALAGFEVLTGLPACDVERIAIVGFCFGGGLAVDLGRMGVEAQAIFGFHPGLWTPANDTENRNITCPVAMCIGTADPYVPADELAEWSAQLRDAGVDLRVERYEGVGHVFTDPDANVLGVPGVAYDRESDERSWAAMLRLFAETIDA